VPSGAEQDVAGLDVQVHQVLAVQVVQRGGHARADLDHLVDGQRRASRRGRSDAPGMCSITM
jgi:hypothetical protein